jgi:hypothetical protein
MMFLDCPAYLDQDGTVRCGLPAEVRRRFIMGSSGGPLECAMIRCPVGHWFNGPIEFLTWDSKHQSGLGTAAAAPPARRASPHDSRSKTLYLRDLTPREPLAVGRMPEFVAETYTRRGATPGRTCLARLDDPWRHHGDLGCRRSRDACACVSHFSSPCEDDHD